MSKSMFKRIAHSHGKQIKKAKRQMELN